ncbi:MAG: hypothetical protein ACYSUB_21565 [Planctomycetota bacterium]|jgi:hypothetical protein
MNNVETPQLAQWRLILHNRYRLDKTFFVGIKTMRRLISYVLTAFILMALTGCQQAGPDSVRTARANYNIAIQQTSSEQLLLNLVRLRYRDTPYFMEVASVSTSFDFNASASASASLPESEGKIYGFGAGVGYTERPTITYTPLQGDQFVTQLMSPVDLDTILLLYHSGWSIERIFRVSLQSVNGDPNKPSVEIRIAEKALEWNEVKQFCDLLGLEYGRTNFRLTTAIGGGGKDRIAAVPRSLMGSLFYVSQSVEVPIEDERMGRVTVTRDVGENRFDWREVTGELMNIHSSKRPPTNAYLAIYYRGSWFHIEDSDLTSKSTFSLLMQLFALQAGEVKSTAPILTLPVSR